MFRLWLGLPLGTLTSFGFRYVVLDDPKPGTYSANKAEAATAAGLSGGSPTRRWSRVATRTEVIVGGR